METIKEEIVELVQLAWRGGYATGVGILAGEKAVSERMRILKLAAKLADKAAAFQPAVQADAEGCPNLHDGRCGITGMDVWDGE